MNLLVAEKVALSNGFQSFCRMKAYLDKYHPEWVDIKYKIEEPPKLDLSYDSDNAKFYKYNYHDQFREFGISKREKFKTVKIRRKI
jgi:hypothetical protein